MSAVPLTTLERWARTVESACEINAAPAMEVFQLLRLARSHLVTVLERVARSVFIQRAGVVNEAAGDPAEAGIGGDGWENFKRRFAVACRLIGLAPLAGFGHDLVNAGGGIRAENEDVGGV